MLKAKKLPGLFLTGILLIAVFSCSKDSEGPSTVDLIVKSSWKFNKATASGVDVSSVVTACIKDNLLTFNTGASANTGNLNEGATKCNAADPQQRDFTWIYDNSFRKINITPAAGGNIPVLPGGSNEFSLVRISETEMVLSQNITYLGATQLVEVTLVH